MQQERDGGVRWSAWLDLMKLTLKWDGATGDGKRAFVVAEENDGWKDLRIEVDTDDCDGEHAKKMMQEVIDRCNRSNDKLTNPAAE